MKSMTGYGCGTAESEGVRATVEIRTVNHRRLEVRVAAAPGFLAESTVVERMVRQRLGRGRVDLALSVEGEGLEEERFTRVVLAYRALDRVRRKLAVEASIDLGAVLYAVLSSGAAASVRAACTGVVTEAAEAALRQVEEMRSVEGEALQVRLREQVREMERLVAQIRAAAAAAREALPERLRARLDALTRAVSVPAIEQERVAREVAVLLERSDVTEEADRLAVHVRHLGATIDGEAAAGRRGDFLAQEILREAGTLTAKAQDASLSGLATELRARAEQVREQLQNVE
jgi:uncharacterized protein (TIGR00255 family)